MTEDRLWRVYVEVRTPVLQDITYLQWVVDALYSRDDVINAQVSVNSQGRKSSVGGWIKLHVMDVQTAEQQALMMFTGACARAGYRLGEVLTVDGASADSS